MADNAAAALVFALVLLYKVERARKGDAADVLFDLLLRHADAIVGNGERFRVLVDFDVNAEVLAREVGFAEGSEPFQLRYGVAGV